MSLADALSAVEREVTKGPACSIAVILAKLDDADRATLEAALADPERRTSVIYTALQAEGHRVSDKTIGRHRRGECKCHLTTR